MEVGERAPLWCTLIVFNLSNVRCSMPPIIVHQSKHYFECLHFNIAVDWKVHHTPSGYIYRDGCIKATTKLSHICSASLVNNQITFFDGHDSHYDDRALTDMKHHKIQPFILKAGNSVNYHPNDNGPNVKIKSHYNEVKSAWILKYRNYFFKSHHMNSILVEAWNAFMVSAGNIIT